MFIRTAALTVVFAVLGVASSGHAQTTEAAEQPAASQGPSAGISCMDRDGTPTTVSQTRRGIVPIIKWTSNNFDASGWTPEKRCQAVSQRFETFRVSGQLKYLTSGRVSGQPVICAVPSQDAPCSADNVLYTLKSGQDPAATLTRLLNVRRGASGPMSETGRRVYVNFNTFIEQQTPDSRAPGGKRASAPLGEDLW